MSATVRANGMQRPPTNEGKIGGGSSRPLQPAGRYHEDGYGMVNHRQCCRGA